MEITMEKELQILSEYLAKQNSLYLDEEIQSSESLKEYLYSLLSVIKSKSSKTFDKVSNNVVTGPFKSRRTFKELFLLLRDNFNITPLDLYRALYELLLERRIRSWICADIGKRVYFISDMSGFDSEDIDEFGISYSKLFGELSIPSVGYYGKNYTRDKLTLYESDN